MYVSANFGSISMTFDQVSYKFDLTLAHLRSWFGPILPQELLQVLCDMQVLTREIL